MNFLSLVNEVLKRLNEVELTQSNFVSAIGFYAQAKDAVNSSIQTINQEQFHWPFNHASAIQTLVPDQVRYDLPVDSKVVDWKNFRLIGSTDLSVSTKRLRSVDYEEYVEKYISAEYDDKDKGPPEFIFRTPAYKFGVYPPPDKAYQIEFEYFKTQPPLVNPDDVPTIPDQYSHVIVDGAMYYAYMFRNDLESANFTLSRFKEGIANMRVININRHEYMRTTVIPRKGFTNVADFSH